MLGNSHRHSYKRKTVRASTPPKPQKQDARSVNSGRPRDDIAEISRCPLRARQSQTLMFRPVSGSETSHSLAMNCFKSTNARRRVRPEAHSFHRKVPTQSAKHKISGF